MLSVDLEFRRGLKLDDVTAGVDRVERDIRAAEPRMRHIFLEADARTRQAPLPDR